MRKDHRRKRAPKFGCDPKKKADVLRCFFASRIDNDVTRSWEAKRNSKMKLKKAKEKKGKLINFKTAHPKIQAGLVASRQKEWDKWKNFHAGIMMKGPELQELIDEGHLLIPTQWVEVDKEVLRKPDTPIEEHETELKSRLVVRGDLAVSYTHLTLPTKRIV